MGEMGNSKLLSDLFTKGSHHKNLSIIYIIQNLYDNSKFHRTASVNTNYLVVFQNPRDGGQIDCLTRQMYSGKKVSLKKLMDDVCKEPYSYMLIDFKPDTPKEARIRTSIFPGEQCDTYAPE